MIHKAFGLGFDRAILNYYLVFVPLHFKLNFQLVTEIYYENKAEQNNAIKKIE